LEFRRVLFRSCAVREVGIRGPSAATDAHLERRGARRCAHRGAGRRIVAGGDLLDYRAAQCSGGGRGAGAVGEKTLTMNGKGTVKKTRSNDHHEGHEGCTKDTKECETGRKWVMTTTLVPKITLWRVIVAVIFAAGLYATYARFALGLSQSTHLTD